MSTTITFLIIAMSLGLPLLIVSLVLYKYLIKPAIERKRIMRIGTPATAEILNLRGTGVRINRTPVVEFELSVSPQAGVSYIAKTKTQLPYTQAAQCIPGSFVDVLIDPQDIQKIIITKFLGNATKPPNLRNSNTQETNNNYNRPTGLNSLQSNFDENLQYGIVSTWLNEHQDILAYGLPSPATITKITELDLLVDGTNPTALLELVVTPELISPFNAITVVAMGSSDTIHIFPGATVQIRYMPNNIQKVAVEKF